MNNFYIAFSVYLNLIFIAAKLWGQITWSWVWVMMPIIVLTIVGGIAAMGQKAKQKQTKNDIISNIVSIKDLLESSKRERAQRDQREGKRH